MYDAGSRFTDPPPPPPPPDGSPRDCAHFFRHDEFFPNTPSRPKHAGVTHHKQTQTHTTSQGGKGATTPSRPNPEPHHPWTGKQPTTTPHHSRGNPWRGGGPAALLYDPVSAVLRCVSGVGSAQGPALPVVLCGSRFGSLYLRVSCRFMYVLMRVCVYVYMYVRMHVCR